MSALHSSEGLYLDTGSSSSIASSLAANHLVQAHLLEVVDRHLLLARPIDEQLAPEALVALRERGRLRWDVVLVLFLCLERRQENTLRGRRAPDGATVDL
eukprot:6524492-Prymnesium_polylepis.1